MKKSVKAARAGLIPEGDWEPKKRKKAKRKVWVLVHGGVVESVLGSHADISLEVLDIDGDYEYEMRARWREIAAKKSSVTLF